VRLSPLGTAAITSLLYQPQMIDDGDCGAIVEIKIGKGNRSTRRTPAPTPLCPPQIPHDQTRARTRTAAVGSQRLNAWTMGCLLLISVLLNRPCLRQHTRIYSSQGDELVFRPRYGCFRHRYHIIYRLIIKPHNLQEDVELDYSVMALAQRTIFVYVRN
jgi:hypothetical protein